MKKNTFFLFIILVLFSTTALSQPSLKIGVGWPVIIHGDKWDKKGSTARIGIGYSWKMSPKWKLGSMVGIKMPWNNPQPNPRINLAVARLLTPKFALGAGLRYEFCPPYGDKTIGNSFALGIFPSWKMKSGITFSFLTGIGIVVRNGPTWALTFQPQISIPF